MKSFVQTLRPLGRNSVAASRNGTGHTVRSFSQQVSDKQGAVVIPNGDKVGMSYEQTRKEKHTKAILKEQGFAAVFSDTVFASMLAQRLYHENIRSNADIIAATSQDEQHATHPDLQNAGKVFVRSIVNGKKSLTRANLQQVIEAPALFVGGKDSSQSSKDCSAIASLGERHFDVDTPEKLWSSMGGTPLVYLSRSTTPTLDRYASEGHINYQLGKPYIHQEAEHFAHTVLMPRFIDRSGRFSEPDNIKPLCGYFFGAGGKQWLSYIHALENILCYEGMNREDAQQLIGKKIKLAGIALMPDIKGLSLLKTVRTLNTVSLFDMGTRPQKEESKHVLGNPEVLEMVKENGGVLHVHLNGKENNHIQHRFLIFGKLSADNLLGHSPKAYVDSIKEHTISRQLYQAYLKGNESEIVECEGRFDERSIPLRSLRIDEAYEKVDETGLAKWEQWKVANFTQQIMSERQAKRETISTPSR